MKKIYALLLCLIVLVSVGGCGKRADSTGAGSETEQNAATNASTTEVDKDGGNGSYSGSISDVEYAFILWSFRDQVVSDFTYTLCDADGDGENELLINAITDEDNSMHTQFIADSNDTRFHFWGYTPTGAAESSNFCMMDGYETILWNRDFSTMDYSESHYGKWTGSSWKAITALDGITFDYGNVAVFDCPNILNIGIKGDSKKIFDSADAYFENRNGADSAGQADLDSDGQAEKVYYVLSAADDWYESLNMENTTENQSFRDHRDIYMTVVIADETSDGVVVRPVRVKYRGSNIEIRENALYINDEEYLYTDTQSSYTAPCLQTALKSPGTYGDFDSQGNRTILSMLNMPFYDIDKMCTDTEFYESDRRMVSAALGESRCTFQFIILPDDESISFSSPAYMVKVDSWNQVTGGLTIDAVPIIGDFCMGDTVGELRTLMVPSTNWKPLLCGQDFLANTNFYYRPSYENENVYFVQVWTDGESEDSKVCAIKFEQIFDLDPTIKEALGLN